MRTGPRPILWLRAAASRAPGRGWPLRAPFPLRAGWGRVGMRPSVRARVVREGVRPSSSPRASGRLPALRPTPPCARVARRAAFVAAVVRRARTPTTLTTTPVEGYLGSRNDEERSEMRYVM